MNTAAALRQLDVERKTLRRGQETLEILPDVTRLASPDGTQHSVIFSALTADTADASSDAAIDASNDTSIDASVDTSIDPENDTSIDTSIDAVIARDAITMGAKYLIVDALPTSRPTLKRMGFVHVSDTWPCELHI